MVNATDPAGSAVDIGRRLAFLGPFVVMVAVSLLLWQPPGGVVLDGAIQGLLVALIAVGLGLVYRATRVVNFAQADLGAVPANLALLLWAAAGWPLLLAVVTGLAAAVLLGAVIEFVFIRRFFRSPRLIVTVATIGITQLLVGLGILLPVWFDDLSATTYDPPFDVTFAFGGTVFDGNDLLVLVVVPLTLVGLAVFLRFSSLGIALRASAESADRASLLGIPVRRLQTVVWSLAAALAFVALFLRIGVVGSTLGRVLEPSILLAALAAAVIGRMERLPTIVSAAVGLGIVSQAVKYDWDTEALRNAVLALVIVVVLFARRVGESGRRGVEVSTWQATREVRPIPGELRGLPEVRIAVIGVALALGAFAVAVPVLASESRVRLAAAIVIFAIIGLSLVVLTGWAGQVSLGQMAVAGIGGAAAGSVVTRWDWDLGLALVVGGLVGAVVLVLVGLPALRARGLAFAVTTLALALVTSSYLLNPVYSPFADWLPEWNVPGEGRVARPELLGRISVASEGRYYVLTLAVLALAFAIVRGLRRSRFGRVLIAARENERAAQAYGLDPRRAAIGAFAVSGFLAGVGGALLQIQQQSLDLGLYAPEGSFQVFSMVVVGGLGSPAGALLGAAYVRGADWFLPSEWAFLATGAGLLLVLLILPGGLGAALGDVRDAWLRRVAHRRDIRVPSLVADTRVERPLPLPAEEIEEIQSGTEPELATPVEIGP